MRGYAGGGECYPALREEAQAYVGALFAGGFVGLLALSFGFWDGLLRLLVAAVLGERARGFVVEIQYGAGHGRFHEQPDGFLDSFMRFWHRLAGLLHLEYAAQKFWLCFQQLYKGPEVRAPLGVVWRDDARLGNDRFLHTHPPLCAAGELVQAVRFEGGVDFGAVKTHDDGAADVQHRNAGLAGFLHCLLYSGSVVLNVFVLVGHVELV